ncbi:MAG: plastocyanin/azurin family copper-binding protein [Polyangiales bacterium]
MNARCVLLAAALTGCGSYFSPTPTPRRDAGGDAAVHGCEPARFVDRSDAAADRTVSFGGAVGMAFSPPCLTVAAGQSVRFAGMFAVHPLRPGVVGQSGSGAGSPIPDTTAGEAVSVTFPAAGVFPFHCGVHGAMGMVGVVRVQ